jgi:hypothetical protein
MELYYGTVRDNRVELDNGARLADGVRVEIRPHTPDEATRDARGAEDLRAAEESFKESLRAAGRLAPPAAAGATPVHTRGRITVSGELLSEQIMRERR